jgi:hypothetical protein
MRPLGVLDLAQQVPRGSDAADARALEAGDEVGGVRRKGCERGNGHLEVLRLRRFAAASYTVGSMTVVSRPAMTL